MDNIQLKITNGAAALAYSILSKPGICKTPSEILRAGFLQEALETVSPFAQELSKLSQNQEITPEISELIIKQNNFLLEEKIIEITEAQKTLLKRFIEETSADIPINKHSFILLNSLDFE